MAIAAVLDAVGLDDFFWDREAAGQHIAALATHAAGAVVRGGVIPATGDPLKVIAGSGLSVTVKAGAYLLPVSDAARGPVVVTLPADVSLTATTADGTHTRLDRVILEVSDDGEAPRTTLAASALSGVTSLSLAAPGVDEPALTTGFYLVGTEVVRVSALSGSGPYTATLAAATTAAHTSGDAFTEAAVRVRLVPGLPAASPAVPSTNWVTPTPGTSLSLGSGAWVALGYVSIGNGATTVGTITDERVFTAAAGGSVPVANIAAVSTLPTSAPFLTADVGERFGVKTAAGYQLFRPNVAGSGVLAGSLPAVPMPYSYSDARTVAAVGGGKSAITWPAFAAVQSVQVAVQYGGSIGTNPVVVLYSEVTTTGCNLEFVDKDGGIVTSGSYVISLLVSGA